MYKKLYLVDKATLAALEKPQERPALSYSEIYDSIIACETQEEKEKPKKATPPRWLHYFWNGARARKTSAKS